MNDERLKMLIRHPSTFILGLTMAFAIGDEWIENNIVYGDITLTKYYLEKDVITAVRLSSEHHLKNFTTYNSLLYVATGGSIICWRRKPCRPSSTFGLVYL